jgi:hypothetical protein
MWLLLSGTNDDRTLSIGNAFADCARRVSTAAELRGLMDAAAREIGFRHFALISAVSPAVAAKKPARLIFVMAIDSKCVPACARKRNFEKCPEVSALFVGVMKTAGRLTLCSTGTRFYDLESKLQTTTERINNDVNKDRKHNPTPPSAPGGAGENLPGVA